MKTMSPSRKLDGICIMILAVLTVIFLWRVVFLGDYLLPLDMLYTEEPWKTESPEKPAPPIWNPIVTDSIWQFIPMASYARDAWRQGPPFWDPYVLAGMPALARGEMFSNPFYHLLSLFLPLGRAVSWLAVFHLLLGSVFTFLFLREIGLRHFGSMVGSIAFTFNTYLIGWLALPVVTGAMVWTPVILWGVERALNRRDWRWTLIGSLGFVLQILEGNILWPFYGAYVVIFYVLLRSFLEWLKRRRIRSSITPLLYGAWTLIVGAALAAPQLLATVELFLHTKRTLPLGASYVTPLKHLIRLLVPDFYGNPIHGNTYWGAANYTETGLYCGILPLLFILAGCLSDRKILAWGLGGASLVTLLAAYGNNPFTQIVSLICPLFLNTFPGRIFYATAFFWAMGAGLGADWIERASPPRALRHLGIGAGILSGIMLALTFWVARYHGAEGAATGSADFLSVKHLRLSGLLLSVIWLLAAALMLYWWKNGKIRKTTFVALALFMIIADLFSIGMRYNPTFEKKFLFPETPSIRVLADLQSSERQPYRLLNIRSLKGMSGQYYRLPMASGYSSFVLSRYSDYAEAAGKPRGNRNRVLFNDCCNPLMDGLNIGYIHAPAGLQLEDEDLEIVYDGPNKIYRNEKAMPRAWIVRQVTEVTEGDTDAVMAGLRTNGFEPRSAAIIEGKSGRKLGKGSGSDQVHVDSYEPERVVINAVLPEAGLLVMSDAMYPGWKAYVENEETPIFTTNMFMRGVFLEAGDHEVVFEYKSDAFRLGSYVTGAALLLIICLLFRPRPHAQPGGRGSRSARSRSSPRC